MVDHHLSNQIIYLFGVYYTPCLEILYDYTSNMRCRSWRSMVSSPVRQKDRPRQASRDGKINDDWVCNWTEMSTISTIINWTPSMTPDAGMIGHKGTVGLQPYGNLHDGKCMKMWRLVDFRGMPVCPDCGQSVAYISSSYPRSPFAWTILTISY